jgi:hypothetical protein
MEKLNLRNIFVVEVTIDDNAQETYHILGENGNEPSSKVISDVILPIIRSQYHPKSSFEVEDIYSVEVGLQIANQI